MAVDYSMRDLEHWDEQIRARVEEFGLGCYEQEFSLCDHFQMLSYTAYNGMPAHYPHWSYGKAYERLKTLYDHGVAGLPYEMVINSDPCLAYLMRENSLCLQILTIAHVYGHNDFFRNNFVFRHTGAAAVIGMGKARADRVRRYVEDPSIGIKRMEKFLDAAHAVSLQCGRHPAIRKLSPAEARERVLTAAEGQRDPYRAIHKEQKARKPDLRRTPIEPDEDILLFIRDHNPYLSEWQRDLLTIVHEEAQYFVPQIETKIMNEGWATYWHREIMNSLDLPQDVRLEFMVRHNQVVQPITGDINPYHVGLKIWDAIAENGEYDPASDDPKPASSDNRAIMFQVRESHRDASFLRRFLSEDLVRELGLFEYARTGDRYVVTKAADREHWRDIKETLIASVGMGGVPVIRVVDADHDRRRALLLEHGHDGRDLHLEYAEKTLAHLHRLWGREVVLATVMDGTKHYFTYDEDGFDVRKADRPTRH